MVDWVLASFVSATLEVGLDQLADFGRFAYGRNSSVEDKLEKVERRLNSLRSLMSDKQRKKALENLAYDTDNLCDEIERIKLDVEGRFRNRLTWLGLAPNRDSIRSELDVVLSTIRSHSSLYPNLVTWNENEGSRQPEMVQTTSLDKSPVFGRKYDMMKVIKLLDAPVESSRPRVSVVAIVGMLGVGKTTLARLIFNSKCQGTESHHFDFEMWVSVTKDFSIMELTRSIIEATRCGNSRHMSLQLLYLELKQTLQNKKFILVLDDMRNDQLKHLENILIALKCGMRGSKIIVTTRSQQVVSLLGGTVGARAYQVKCLSDKDCWLLLKNQALLGVTTRSIDPVLEAIGKNIARKCYGFPLLAKSLGRQLRDRIEENVWKDILKTKIYSEQNEVVEAVRSSVCYDFPSHLKGCFAYCSIFPQDFYFDKDKLVRMWMAEGLIVPDKKHKFAEDKGSEYFDELFRMTIFDSDAVKHQMNKAIHDLAQSVCSEKFFRMVETDDLPVLTDTRYLSLVCEKTHISEAIHKKMFEASYKCVGLRTLLLFSDCGSRNILTALPFLQFSKLKDLRVLDLSDTRIKELAKDIGSLIHLRFLDLSNTLIKRLPETMHELWLLQTLRLINCSELLCLPKKISSLKSLRHLELGRDSPFTSMPSGIGKLTSLQTLTEFVVGGEPGQMKELRDLNNIRGSLCIRQIEKVRDADEARDANFSAKVYLDELELQWTSVLGQNKDEAFFRAFMGHYSRKLKGLTVRNYAGTLFPRLRNIKSGLTKIFFKGCTNCTSLDFLGDLPDLRSAKFEGMSALRWIDEAFFGPLEFRDGICLRALQTDGICFRALQTLELRDMPNLERWDGMLEGDMPRLRELIIAQCPVMVTVPSLHFLRSLETLEFESCELLSHFSEETLSRSTQSLVINDCPRLKERYNRDGEEWTKIQHIPQIEIDYQRL